MRLLFLILFALVASVGLAVLAVNDPGYVLITRGPWVVETSVSFAVISVVLTFALTYGGLRLVKNLWNLPRRMRALRRHRRGARARRVGLRGFMHLAEGYWGRAERDLVRAAEEGEAPLIHYLAAARAAQEQSASQRRDHYLSLAHRAMPEAELAVGLTQAEVQMAQGQWEQALATLMHLRTVAPKHARVLYLLHRLYERLGDWKALAALLPEMRKLEVLSAEELGALERKVYARLLDGAAKGGQPATLRETWEAIPRDLRADPTVAGAFARNLGCLGQGAEAEELLREVLRGHWDPELVRLYGMVRGEDLNRQLATAEGWLKKYDRNALLLLTLGRICLHNRLWGKARTYLEASLGMEPRAETYRELGVLLFQFKEFEHATECFRKGLETAVGADGCTAFKM